MRDVDPAPSSEQQVDSFAARQSPYEEYKCVLGSETQFSSQPVFFPQVFQGMKPLRVNAVRDDANSLGGDSATPGSLSHRLTADDEAVENPVAQPLVRHELHFTQR